MSSLSITNNASIKTMKKEVKRLETFIAAQLLCMNANWETTTPSLKGNHFQKAKFYVQRFAELLAMPTNDEVVMLALRACHSKIFDQAVQIDSAD